MCVTFSMGGYTRSLSAGGGGAYITRDGAGLDNNQGGIRINFNHFEAVSGMWSEKG